jgi:hypothetical protein
VRAIVRGSDAARLEAEDLVAIAEADVAALVSAFDRAPAPDPIELRRHERITGRIHASAPSLPSRFGQFFDDEASLGAALRERRAALLDELDFVGDRAEMSVTLTWRAPREEPPAATMRTGREFLEAKSGLARERREAEALVARFVDYLAVDQATTRRAICPRQGVAAIVALLIARDGAEALRQEVDSFEQRSSDVTARVYGPLPPYSFAS